MFQEATYISKQLEQQRFIFKINSARLRKSNWRLELSIQDARRNQEVISMGSSQVLRWIDELNGVTDADVAAKNIKSEIRKMKREPACSANRKRIKELYAKLDEIQFKPDYMCLVIDREKDYRRACKGFFINGIKYSRLLGTAGGIKNSTIVFVSERLYPELNRRINNGRDETKEMVPAKFEAYRALACSASVPVSLPNGILVVKDVETTFRADTVYLDDEGDGEPKMEFKPDTEITMDASDGYGLMLPSLAERWSGELGLDYVMAGCNTRFSFEKGMVFTFDFIDFAENVAHKSVVTDVWGNEKDIHDVELIFTESMLKLWDSYKSCDDYIENCVRNNYTIGVPKTCPAELENERSTNYQFIQSYDLSYKDIDDLISPTVDEIHEVISGDWRKTILFLCGMGLNEKNADIPKNDYIKAMMIDHRVADDPFVQKSVYQLIRNRIDEAKVGVLNIHGNYSMISGDPFSLCQNIFGLPVTGILKAGEIYNRYWADDGAEKVACFRAPMSTHENVRVVSVNRSEEALYWYRYMNTCTILNSFDCITAAMNGADFDGDLMMLTDNKVLVEKYRELPTIMCVQRKAKKMIPTEENIIRANIASFGNEIGQVTNRTTSMYEVRTKFRPGTKEYETLTYRIMCGQLIQQNVIDKTKGIVAKPMPKTWYDRHAIGKIEDDEEREFYRSIVADRKPYFMRYIYPDLKKQYNTYIKNTDKNAMREFGMSVEELKEVPYRDLTERQKEFLHYYSIRMPVGMGDCVMNRICRRFEEEFDGVIGRAAKTSSFDYRILRNDSEYTDQMYRAVKHLYDEFNSKMEQYKIFAYYERADRDEFRNTSGAMLLQFERDCTEACPNEDQLCNILLDLCYSRSKSKQFVWSVCGETIIRTLLKKNGMKIEYPALSDDGDIEYRGNRFEIREKEITEENADRNE